MNFWAAVFYLHGFMIVHSSEQFFIKRGHVLKTTDLSVFAVHTLEIKSIVECALHCAMNVLCNAFDLCFLDGLYTCRFRSGHTNLSNTTTQCEHFEIRANKDCPNGFFSRSRGICKNILLNIALGKPATQSTTYRDYNATHAVDGNRETDVGVDKCAYTDHGDSNPWWRVDLQAVYNITSVRILNRGNKYGDVSHWLHDFTVTVGLTESDVNTLCGYFRGPGTASQLVVIDCLTSPQGRFVKISKTTRYLSLCEVDVFGVPG